LEDKKAKLSKEQKDFISEIYDSNERMIALVNDLLNVSRIETGKNFEVKKQKTDLIPILKEVIGEQELIAKSKKIEILFGNDFSDKVILDIDGIKIKQVLQNLLNNAIKYSPENTKVSLGLKDEGKKMLFFVKDSGFGIPLDQQKRIFEKFFRANNVLMTGAEGTGLGLYIVRSIIEAHGGKVWFESKENKGTTFYIEIPKK
jgi:signal transduction histidine kinase